jgi:hypothetical protein
MACYDGKNPVTDDERYAIWKWAKANGIDHGLSIDQVHDAINSQFFGGMAPSEWINDILSGRKTPFRTLADAAWKAQYNRRIITQQAREALRQQTLGPVQKYLGKLWNAPRGLATIGHFAVFPVSHAGDLAFRPQSWGIYLKGLLDTYSKSPSPAAYERLLKDTKREALWDLGLRSGVDAGENSHPSGILGAGAKGWSARAWGILGITRFKLWNREMERYIKPGMSQEEILDIGKRLAVWANHATGSAKGPIASLGGKVWFGPKLFQSRVSRLTIDPINTIKTFTNWNNATAGEKAVALTRLSGLGQYMGTYLGFLAVNYGLNKAFGVPDDKNVNWKDPTKGDWLSFKAGGLEWHMPGLHTELRTLGQIMAASLLDDKDFNKKHPRSNKQTILAQIFGQYVLGKTHPTIQLGKEILTGQDYRGRPMPWSPSPGTKYKPRYGSWEWALTHAPIPLTEPIRYVFDKLREGGASSLDALAITRGIIITAVGATGIHIGVDYGAEPKPKPTLHQAVGKQRAAAHLQGR